MKSVSRRRFLKRAGQAAAAAAAGVPAAPNLLAGPANDRAPTLPKSAGSWPMYRGDTCLTGRAALPGELRDAPAIAWRYPIEAGEAWAVIHAAEGQRHDASTVKKDALAA